MDQHDPLADMLVHDFVNGIRFFLSIKESLESHSMHTLSSKDIGDLSASYRTSYTWCKSLWKEEPSGQPCKETSFLGTMGRAMPCNV